MQKRFIVFMMTALLGGSVVACGDDDDDEPTGPQPEVFVATLTGAAEVPPVTTNASGTARVEFTPTGLSWTVNVTNIQGVTTGGAHIHASPTTTTTNTAGVVLNLNPNTAVTTGLLTAGTATATNTGNAISMDSLKVLIRTGRAYVNVHTTANPGGHIRGQLVPGT